MFNLLSNDNQQNPSMISENLTVLAAMGLAFMTLSTVAIHKLSRGQENTAMPMPKKEVSLSDQIKKAKTELKQTQTINEVGEIAQVEAKRNHIIDELKKELKAAQTKDSSQAGAAGEYFTEGTFIRVAKAHLKPTNTRVGGVEPSVNPNANVALQGRNNLRVTPSLTGNASSFSEQDAKVIEAGRKARGICA